MAINIILCLLFLILAYLCLEMYYYTHLSKCKEFYESKIKKFGMSFAPHIMGEGHEFIIFNDRKQSLDLDNYRQVVKFLQRCIDTDNADFAQALFDEQEKKRRDRDAKIEANKIPRKYRS